MALPFLQQSLEYLKGIGPKRAEVLAKELKLKTYGDLLFHFPYRYEDRSQWHRLDQLAPDQPYVQVRGRFTSLGLAGAPRKQRLVGSFTDGHGTIEVVWFRGVKYMEKYLEKGKAYHLFGRPNVFKGKISLPHPEVEPAPAEGPKPGGQIVPVYTTTEAMKRSQLDSKVLRRALAQVVNHMAGHVSDTLPPALVQQHRLMDYEQALSQVHFPTATDQLQRARYRLKFEEFLHIQLQLLRLKWVNTEQHKGIAITAAPLVNEFYEKHLPFPLTEAQKRVVREIYTDMRGGKQMNRLLQGDVGSGKTVVAFIAALLAIGQGHQASLMAPTEILAEQHYRSLQPWCQALGLRVALLTGSTPESTRRPLHQALAAGEVHLLVGTHALLEDRVRFRSLALAIMDEQHRFGVAQRSRMWGKNKSSFPHILVMTATPIPRTLAMTLYGDLDLSVIDQLPPGRKPIKTELFQERSRLKVNGFLKRQIDQGRQVYVVFPLIEESRKLDLKNLMEGYEQLCRDFPEYDGLIGVLHGRMSAANKEAEMKRFVQGTSKMLVSTTVIEVGVNVPNATVMVIENAERFGLAQLHQLRGRVGRGAEQSHCLLMASDKLGKEARERLSTMVRSNDGFVIADKDLEIRGPGDMMGTQQSGLLTLQIGDLATDQPILQLAREAAKALLDQDPGLEKPEHRALRQVLHRKNPKGIVPWDQVS